MRVSVRTRERRGCDQTELVCSVAGGTPVRPARPSSSLPKRLAAWCSRRQRPSSPRRALTGWRVPSEHGRRPHPAQAARSDLHDVVGLVRRLSGTRRVGHGGHSIRSRPECCPCFWPRDRLVEYHMGDDKAYRATVCFGASSATDDRDGELVRGDGQPNPRSRGRGPGGVPRADRAAAAGIQRTESSRAAGIRAGAPGDCHGTCSRMSRFIGSSWWSGRKPMPNAPRR